MIDPFSAFTPDDLLVWLVVLWGTGLLLGAVTAVLSAVLTRR